MALPKVSLVLHRLICGQTLDIDMPGSRRYRSLIFGISFYQSNALVEVSVSPNLSYISYQIIKGYTD